MPANKYALLRYRIIDRCLTNTSKSFPSKEDLRMACEDSLYGSMGEHISESTIEKDLWAMRNEGELGYYAPISYHKGHKGYYYEDPDYTINDVSLSDEDIEAIRFAANTLFQFREIPIFQQFDNAIDKIINRLNISPDVNDAGIDAFVQFESSESVLGSEYLEVLLKAIRERFVVEFTYKKFNASDARKYVAHPCLLKEYRSRWYLIVLIPGESRYRTFGLERVENLEVTREKFDRDSNFDARRLFKNSIGITELDEDPQIIKIRFDKSQAPYIESNPLHKSQKVVERLDDYTVIELYVQQTYELVNAILGFGSHARVVEPESLRNQIIQENDKVRDLYN
jgi:predicted DNA-binding transcriptional regulator YafY